MKPKLCLECSSPVVAQGRCGRHYQMYRKSPEFKAVHARHGMARTTTYRAWINMRSRCGDESNTSYSRYGGRGIRVAEKWLDSFENFLSDMGECPPGRSLDRIDNDGDYEPGNCRWATKKQQSNNRDVTVFISANGETHTLPEWERITGISRSTIDGRIKRGWSRQDAVTKPPVEIHERTNFRGPPRKLSDSDVQQIRVRATHGEPQRAIAHDYGVAQATISKIVRGQRRWR